MNANSLLDQLLKTGAAALGNATQAASSPDGRKYATGAAVGGVLGLLLGSRSGRRLGGSAIKLGSVAALGMLAWNTYNDWQAQQAQAGAAGAGGEAGAGAKGAPVQSAPPALPAPQADAHGRALLKAMIAAAKSDGHLDERERELVQAELRRTDAGAELSHWVQVELQQPLNAAAVAAQATGPEMAAEIYLASVLVVDETSAVERAYLDQLAQALRLAPSLQADLEARARAA
jgi:uncharacterized membrane protein YebE (DUF533 family)